MKKKKAERKWNYERNLFKITMERIVEREEKKEKSQEISER